MNRINKLSGFVCRLKILVNFVFLYQVNRSMKLQKAWQGIRRLADIKDVRIHGLRHTFASVAVMNGMSLPMVGALLGHSQPRTTARYAHLAIDPLLDAVELVGKKLLYGNQSPR